jgi:hypothetical protein
MSRKGFQGQRDSSQGSLHEYPVETKKGQGPWLSLLEYSAKYEVSISTLRRRIRSETIQFQLEEGKYLVLDEPLPPLEAKSLEFVEETMPTPTEKSLEKNSPVNANSMNTSNADAVSKLLLDELKRAYAMILQEKEEQICQLREEISDLRTLVRVLESENARVTRDQ